MNVSKKSLLLVGCLFILAGCSSQSGAASAGAAQPGVQAAAAQSDTVKADLDIAARQLVERASRTVTPSKAKPKVTRSGKSYVVSYIDINPDQVITTVRPGSSAHTPYTGTIEYTENHMQCTGKTKAEALSDSGQCKNVKSRRMKEMIRHDGKRWQF